MTQVTKFSSLGIKSEAKGFVGDKIDMNRILNREIVIHAFKVEKSKFKDGQCLHMQISIGDTKHVVFTPSKRLIETIEQIPNETFPVSTTIEAEGKSLKFT